MNILILMWFCYNFLKLHTLLTIFILVKKKSRLDLELGGYLYLIIVTYCYQGREDTEQLVYAVVLLISL